MGQKFFIASLLFLSGCQTTISQRDIQMCRLFCEDRRGLYRVIADTIRGVGCHCKNGNILWLEIGDRGPFEDRLDIDDGDIDTESEREFVK